MIRRGTPDPVASMLADARRRQGLTLTELSERIVGGDGLRTKLSMYERGLTSPTLRALRAWTDALGVDLVLLAEGAAYGDMIDVLAVAFETDGTGCDHAEPACADCLAAIAIRTLHDRRAV
jgi:transcriptional regulator with XRE-family HTH domain